MLVSVLTAALPERRGMLDEAIASVRAQAGDVEHLYAFDEERQGAGPVLNRLLEEARGEWVMVLDDDDLLDPDHLTTLLPHTRDADVVYSQPRIEGQFVFRQYGEPFDAATLAVRNIVSHNALMRRSLVEQVGGWRPVRPFDWDIFQRLEAAGALFHQLHDVTWTYRLHGANWSHGTLTGAP